MRPQQLFQNGGDNIKFPEHENGSLQRLNYILVEKREKLYVHLIAEALKNIQVKYHNQLENLKYGRT